MNEYRRPDEWQAQTDHEDRVRAVLDRAVHDGASLLAAMDLGEEATVVESWVNALWNGLRDNLSDERQEVAGLLQEDRLTAIGMLLYDRMNAEADELLDAVHNPEGTEQ
jgi:hypothetical protein